MIHENFVYLGVVLNLIGSLTYVWNTLKGRTKPNQVTWFLWALAPLIAFSAMLGQGVGIHVALMTFMVGFGPLLVLIASFVNRRSVWKLTKFDITCGVMSLAGLIGWLFTQTGDVAIFFSIVADGLAALPTIVKAWKDPESENGLILLNGALSAIITMLVLKVWDFAQAGFTVYIFILCVILFLLIYFKLGPMISELFRGIGKEDIKEVV